jgi:hypothetical protein
MSTVPCPFSNAGQALTGRLPSAMFTPVIRSEMFTTPERPQSPTQAITMRVAVGDGLAVLIAAGVLVGVELALGVLVGVHELQMLGVGVGVFVGRLVRFDVRVGRAVRVTLRRLSCACPTLPVMRKAASTTPMTPLLAVHIISLFFRLRGNRRSPPLRTAPCVPTELPNTSPTLVGMAMLSDQRSLLQEQAALIEDQRKCLERHQVDSAVDCSQ